MFFQRIKTAGIAHNAYVIVQDGLAAVVDPRLLFRWLRQDDEIVVTCSVGHRGSLGVSMLLRHGFERVSNLLGGMTAWQGLGLPVRKEDTIGKGAV